MLGKDMGIVICPTFGRVIPLDLVYNCNRIQLNIFRAITVNTEINFPGGALTIWHYSYLMQEY